MEGSVGPIVNEEIEVFIPMVLVPDSEDTHFPYVVFETAGDGKESLTIRREDWEHMSYPYYIDAVVRVRPVKIPTPTQHAAKVPDTIVHIIAEATVR